MREAALSGRVSRWRAMPAGGRRSEPGVPCGGAAGRALRACGPRADRRSAFQAGAPRRESGGWGFLRLRDVGEQGDVTLPAGGGLCRLKPAFQAGGAVRGAGRRALRAYGPRAGLKTGGPRRHAVTGAGMFQAGALPRESGNRWFVGSCDRGERADVVSPAPRAMLAGGRRSEGVASRRSGGWWFSALARCGRAGRRGFARCAGDAGRRPALRGGATRGWRPSGRCAL